MRAIGLTHTQKHENNTLKKKEEQEEKRKKMKQVETENEIVIH